MILLAVAFIYLSILFIHSGLLMQLSFERSFKNAPILNPFYSFWLGIGFVGFIASIFNFFTPIDSSFHAILLGIIALSSIPYRKTILDRYKLIWSGIKSLPWIYFVLMSFVSVVILIAASDAPIYNLDPARYHYQIIEWAKNYSIVPGVANLHERYGAYSAWHLLYAIFDHGSWAGKAYHLLNGLMFIHFIGFGLYHLFRLLKQWSFISLLVGISIVYFSYYGYYIYYWYLSCPTPDLSSLLFSFLGFSFFFEYIARKQDKSEMILHSMVMATITFAGFAYKLNGIFACVTIAYPFFILIVQGWKSTSIREKLLFFAIPVLFSTVRFTQNEITSGFIMYPMTSIDVFEQDWETDVQRTNGWKKSIRYSAFAVPGNPEEQQVTTQSKAFSDLFPNWIKWQLSMVSFSYLIIIALFVLLLDFLLMKKRNDLSLFKQYGIGLVFVTICLGFWYFSAPDIRFGMQNMSLFVGLSFGFFIWIFKDKISSKIAGYTGIGLTTLLFLVILMRLTPISVSQNHVMYPIKLVQYLNDRNEFFELVGTPQVSYKKVGVGNGLILNVANYSTEYADMGRARGFVPFHYSEEAIQNAPADVAHRMKGSNSGISLLNWAVPLPATVSIYPGVEPRSNDLQDGFRINPSIRRKEVIKR